MKKFFSGFSQSDNMKLMIFPFWACVILLWQMFYPLSLYSVFPPPSSNVKEPTTVFFTVFLTVALSILTIWIVELIEHTSRDNSKVYYPNLPYNLFYHYRLKSVTRHQVVYLVRRLSDGVYKVGKAGTLDKRMKDLQREYGPIAIIAVWEVSDCAACERVALERTRGFSYKEGDRQELRTMLDWQCWQFISDFTKYVVELDTLGPEVQSNEQSPLPALWG